QENATVKAAEAISEGAFGHELQQSEKEPAGAAVHYAFGTTTGALYGALAEVAPQVTTVAGLPFGAGFWLLGFFSRKGAKTQRNPLESRQHVASLRLCVRDPSNDR